MSFWQTAENMTLILETIPTGVFIIDNEGVIREWNHQMEVFTGYQASEVIGESYTFLVCDDNDPASLAVRCPILTGQQDTMIAYECKLNSILGEHIPVLRNAAAIKDADGDLIGVIQSVTDLRPTLKLEEEVVALREEAKHRSRGRIIGKSAPMQHIFEQIELAADSTATVLLLGETGTGKELVVDAVHEQGTRKDGPLVKVNCSALPESLLESELFGHVKGAFTGAIQDKVGRFERANGGTIFLDEIGELSPLIQLKLLRVLQERVIERVGEAEPRNVDVRVVAATHRDLKQLVADGVFREDLYYRLHVFPIHMPPLRERRDDIPILVQHFIDRFNMETGKRIQGMGAAALTAMMAADWRGNVRELENAIEHAFVTCRGDVIELEHLPMDIRQDGAQAGWNRPEGGAVGAGPTFPAPVPGAARPKATTSGDLLGLLEAHNWKRQAVADALGINRVTLWRKMKELGIQKR